MITYYQFSILDILPYFYMLATLLAFSFPGGRKINAFVPFLLLFAFSSLRYGVGKDFFSYYRVMEGTLTVEPISQLIGNVASAFNCYQLFYIINAGISLYAIYYVVKKESINPQLSLFLLFILPFLYLESFSIIRSFSAYSIVFLSYFYIKNNKYIPYILCIIIASLFHASAVIGLFFIPLKIFNYNKTVAIILFCSSFFITDILLNVLSQLTPDSYITMKLVGYSTSGAEEMGRSMKYIIALLNILNIVFWNRLVQYDKKNLLYLNIVNMGAVFWFAMGFDITLSLRTSSFFLLFEILLIPSYFYIFKRKYQKIINVCLMSFFIALFISGFVINIRNYTPSKRMSYIPYQTVFFGERYVNY